MLFDFEQMTPMQCFEFLTGTVVPRPIALITTQSPEGLVNAAPYSFFNIMGIEPPVVAFTVLPSPDGRIKDTGRNILATREFVVNLVSEELAEAMNVTCIDAPANVEELSLADLATAPSSKVRTPRVERSPIAFECVAKARELLSVPAPVKAPEPENDDPCVLPRPCPGCGGRMLIIETFERGATPRHKATPMPPVISIDSS